LTAKIVSGESNSVSEEDYSFWKEKVLDNILKDYEPNNIFNMDEIGIFSNAFQIRH